MADVEIAQVALGHLGPGRPLEAQVQNPCPYPPRVKGLSDGVQRQGGDRRPYTIRVDEENVHIREAERIGCVLNQRNAKGAVDQGAMLGQRDKFFNNARYVPLEESGRFRARAHVRFAKKLI